MRITSSTIALNGERSSLRALRVEERSRVQTGTANGSGTRDAVRTRTQLDLEVEHYSRLGRTAVRGATPTVQAAAEPRPLWTPATPRTLPAVAMHTQPAPAAGADEADALLAAGDDLLLIKLVIEILSGRAVQVARIDMSPADAATATPAPGAPAAQPAGQFAVDYSYSSHYVEAESTRFTASGTLLTDDGTRVDFALDVLMQRRFESSTRIEFQAGARKDPLMIDFGGAGPALSPQRIAFDLDADGHAEQIAAASGESAFVALDRNGNGRIDDGSELFGTASGDGFADLAAFDVDGNGFIDEGDPVFVQLLAWQRDAAGNDRVASLSARGVGALWLGSVATPFALRDANNADLGAVRASGVYIREDGGVGALQQVDLAV